MPEFGEGQAEVLVKEMGFTVVSVGYRYGPENVFPTAAYDAIDAVNWVCCCLLLSTTCIINLGFHSARIMQKNWVRI